MAKILAIIGIVLVIGLIFLAFVNARQWMALTPFDTAAQKLAPFDYVELSHGPVHYRWQGDENGPVIVMVHGFSTPLFIFEQNAAALAAAGYRVLRFDHYGRGWSARPSARYDKDFYDTTLLQVLNQLVGAQPVHLMGLSMGGIITAEFTARHPERVKTLTLFVPAGLDIRDMGLTGKLLQWPIIGTYLWNNRAVPGLKITPKPAEFPPSHHLQGDLAVQYQYRGTAMALLQTLRHLPMSDEDHRFGAVAAHKIPTLALFGAIDSTVPIASAARLEKVMPEADIEIFETGEHTVNFDHFPEVNVRLLSWLAQHK